MKASPFEVLYGHAPRHFGISVEACAIPDLQEWLKERKLMQALVQQHLNRANQQMKHMADKKRSFRSFAEGDWVYLKLQPYVQSSVATRANHKLSFKYFGPFQVLQKIGTVAYKLQLPETSNVHPVFHVSQLKAARGFQGDIQSTLPSALSDLQVPLQILDTRVINKGNSAVSQVLIHWFGTAAEDATWEDLEELRARFPATLAWGQAKFQGEGIVKEQAVPGDVPLTEDGEQNSDEAEDHQAGAVQSKGGNLRRTTRPVKQNPKYCGPNWAM